MGVRLGTELAQVPNPLRPQQFNPNWPLAWPGLQLQGSRPTVGRVQAHNDRAGRQRAAEGYGATLTGPLCPLGLFPSSRTPRP